MLYCIRTPLVGLAIAVLPVNVLALGKGEARFIQLMATAERLAELRNEKRYLDIGRHVCTSGGAAKPATRLAAELAQLDKSASVTHVAVPPERDVIQENMAAYGIAGKARFHTLKTARVGYRVTVLQRVNGQPIDVTGTQIWLFHYRKTRWCFQPG